MKRVLAPGLIVALACSAVPAQDWTPEGMATDLDFLLENLDKHHPAQYRIHSRERWQQVAAELRGRLKQVDAVGFFAGLAGVVALAADGHTALSPTGAFRSALAARTYPLKFGYFDGAVHITAAAPQHGTSVGSRVVAIGGRPMDEIVDQLVSTTAADNAWAAKLKVPDNLIFPLLLHHLGLSKPGEDAVLTIEGKGGKRETLKLAPPSGGPPLALGPTPTDWADATWDGAPKPLWLKNADKSYWFEHLAEQKIVFMQFNAVRNSGSETFEKFCGRLFEFIERNDVDKLIVDMRRNGGGNNYLNQPLVHGLIGCTKVNELGRLFVITSPRTFSAAVACVADIEQRTHAVFVGEPTGAGPNHAGDADTFTLPHSKLRLRISKLWWQWSDPRDKRRAIRPDVPAPLTFEAFVAGRDPALEAIFAFDPKSVNDLKRHPPNIRWRVRSRRN